MSIAQIEAEMERLSPEELRRLALRSWTAYLGRERAEPNVNQCDEDSPELLAALDDAVRRSDDSENPSFNSKEVRSRLDRWTTK